MDEDTPSGSRLGEKAGAMLLILLAAGLLFIGADMLTGGKLTPAVREGDADDCGC